MQHGKLNYNSYEFIGPYAKSKHDGSTGSISCGHQPGGTL